MDKDLDDMPLKRDNGQVLIDATLDAIAEVGLLRTSVSEIIRRAGLSRGMIHLHFQGKENLIAAAAEHSVEEYYDRLESRLAAARPEPQYRVEAMILCDLNQEGLSERIVRISHELQAAARAYPTLSPFSDTRDTRLRNMFQTAFAEIIGEADASGIQKHARDLTIATVAMMEGFWVDFMLHPQDFDRDLAARIVFRMLAGMLPHHFNIDGAIG